MITESIKLGWEMKASAIKNDGTSTLTVICSALLGILLFSILLIKAGAQTVFRKKSRVKRNYNIRIES